MGESVPVQPLGDGLVPTGINCFPTYGRGPASDGGTGSWSGVVLQIEDGVMWFLPTYFARALLVRLVLATAAAEMNEGHAEDTVGWDDTATPPNN